MIKIEDITPDLIGQFNKATAIMKRAYVAIFRVHKGIDGYVIQISTVKANLKVFFEYLKLGQDYEEVERIMPWKFDINLLKRDVIGKK